MWDGPEHGEQDQQAWGAMNEYRVPGSIEGNLSTSFLRALSTKAIRFLSASTFLTNRAHRFCSAHAQVVRIHSVY